MTKTEFFSMFRWREEEDEGLRLYSDYLCDDCIGHCYFMRIASETGWDEIFSDAESWLPMFHRVPWERLLTLPIVLLAHFLFQLGKGNILAYALNAAPLPAYDAIFVISAYECLKFGNGANI